MNSIIRVSKDKKNPYVMINKGFLNDGRLSWKAKGLLAYILSKPDNWTIRISDLENKGQDGKRAIYSGLKELKQYGYLERYPIRRDGKIHHWESVIYESPVKVQKLHVQNEEVENEDVENEPLLINDILVNNDLNNKSVSQSESEIPGQKRKERPTDKAIKEIIENSGIDYFTSETEDLIKNCIADLYKHGTKEEPLEEVRKQLTNTSRDVIQLSILKYQYAIEEKEASGEPISNAYAYFKKIFYNALKEISLSRTFDA